MDNLGREFKRQDKTRRDRTGQDKTRNSDSSMLHSLALGWLDANSALAHPLTLLLLGRRRRCSGQAAQRDSKIAGRDICVFYTHWPLLVSLARLACLANTNEAPPCLPPLRSRSLSVCELSPRAAPPLVERPQLSRTALAEFRYSNAPVRASVCDQLLAERARIRLRPARRSRSSVCVATKQQSALFSRPLLSV